MDNIKLQDLFNVPIVYDVRAIGKLPNFIKLELEKTDESSLIEAYCYIAQQGNYLDIGELFTELQINVFNDNSYRLIFRGNAANCKKQPFTARFVFYNALHKILGEDDKGAEYFTLTDLAILQFGGERLFSKWWRNSDAMFDLISIDEPVEFSIDSHFITELLNVEIENTPELCKIKRQDATQPMSNLQQSQNSGCLSVIIIAVILSALFAI